MFLYIATPHTHTHTHTHTHSVRSSCVRRENVPDGS